MGYQAQAYGNLLGSWDKSTTKKSWWFRISRKRWLNDWGELNPSQRSILMTLWLYAGKKNKCWPSMRQLAEDLKINKETVNESIKFLIKKDYIKAEQKINQRGHYFEYTLLK